MAHKRNPVGTQLFGWGQIYQREKKSLQEHLDEVLSAVRDCGYDYAEGFLDVARPENNAAFADKLKAKGLESVAIYSGGRLHEQDKVDESIGKLLAAAAVCQKAGFVVLNLNPDPIGREKTDDELKVQAAALEKLGTGLLELGMVLAVHNHTPEMVNKAREFHHNFRATDPGRVGLCLDTHWVFRGGLAPMSALRHYHDRLMSWHLRQSRDQIWWEDLDEGDIDYAEIAEFAGQHDFVGPFTVELAIENGTKLTRSVVENNKRSREFVRRVFGV